MHTTAEQRRRFERLDANSLAEAQLRRLNALLSRILPDNRFYAEKLAGFDLPLQTLDQLSTLPFTYKDELANVPHYQFAANLTFPVEQYVRFHRTSGTRGRQATVLDTAEDWQWWLETWQYTLDAANIGSLDRICMAFSYGPFIGFWSGHDAAVQRGALVLACGGLSTDARLELIQTRGVTALFCTPGYALHLAAAGAANQMDVAALDVRKIVVGGEPGGSLPGVRQRIERAWNAHVVDHAGASEVGPWGYGDEQGLGLRVIESEFIAEFISVETGQPASENELSELVLTSLGRVGSPAIRYRTGDLVRPSWNSPGENQFVLLEGGLLGRTDDMVVIRGMNVFPNSVERILGSFPEVIEYQMIATRDHELDVLTVEVEDRLEQPERISRELRLRLGLTVEVRCVAIGTLPRVEGPGRRFIDRRLT